jgi:hypothetical protein
VQFAGCRPESANPGVGRHSGIGEHIRSKLPNNVKEDCETLVSGQLVFTPIATMQQGVPYIVSARLSRNTDAKITSGLEGKGIVIQDALVSCLVAMDLDAQEPGGFKIENVPAERKDQQMLLPDAYTQWDWRVTPIQSGTLHLLLYVTPMLNVDKLGVGLKEFPQPARIITVSPDYVFTIENAVSEHWGIIGTLLSPIIIPIFLWARGKLGKRKAKPSVSADNSQ